MRRYPIDNELAAQLRRRRLAAGLSQAELARRSNVFDLTISRIERSLGGVSPEAREAIERVLAAAEQERDAAPV